MNYVVAIDIGGTNLRIGVLDEEYRLTHFRKVYRSEVMSDADPVSGLVDYLKTYIADCGVPISAVAAGAPATLDKARRVVLSAPNIPNFDRVPLAEALEQGLGIPAYLERDVSMIFQRDMTFNRLPEDALIIGCYVGTGIGNAIWMGGGLLAGKDGAAGEIGHIPMIGRTDVCGCGNTGCIELYAGGKNLERIAGTLDTPIGEVFTRCADHPAVREYIDNIAVAVAAEINILNPDLIVLGGGVLAMADFPRSYLEERIRARARKPYPAETLEFIYSEDADENGVIGGGIYAQKKLKERNGK